MRTFKKENKNGQNILSRASYVAGKSIYDCYDKPSAKKVKAYHDCLSLCNSMDGSNFHICSYNTFGFTVSWTTDDGVYLITKDNSFFVAC